MGYDRYYRNRCKKTSLFALANNSGEEHTRTNAFANSFKFVNEQ